MLAEFVTCIAVHYMNLVLDATRESGVHEWKFLASICDLQILPKYPFPLDLVGDLLLLQSKTDSVRAFFFTVSHTLRMFFALSSSEIGCVQHFCLILNVVNDCSYVVFKGH